MEAWRKEFYNVNRSLILAKKQLDLLNKGLVSNPTEHSITTYGLHYDDDKKQWVSDLVEKTNVVKIAVKKPKDEVVQDIKEVKVSPPKKEDRATRSKTKAVFGEGKPRKPNAWLQHVQKVKADNPELTYKEILNLASTTYKKAIK